ncbi:MAG: 4Fe-4S dicluster domain-containing protein [Elusimicrobia bacterium]|nr:4Fe-4S dicluster domain-containing protein [Elusimicrobiota bacterium]
MKKIYFNEEYCMACRLCEIACLVAHSKSKKIIKAYKEEFPSLTPRLIIEQKGPLSFAIQCRHCKDAPCVEACVTGAMKRGKKTGAVSHDREKCVGCWMCIMSCPFGVILMDTKEKKVATKCDLCEDVREPACVDACPNEALVYKEVKGSEKK